MVAGLEHMVYKKLRRLGLFRLEKQGLTKRNHWSLQLPGGVTEDIIFKAAHKERSKGNPNQI